MVTIKSYTDLEQSKKLAAILPIESADMVIWGKDLDSVAATDAQKFMSGLKDRKMNFLPCWSLVALFNVLPDSIYDNTSEFSQLEFTKKSVAYIHGTADDIKIGVLKDNLIDACYEMILKLHELKMLELQVTKILDVI